MADWFQRSREPLDRSGVNIQTGLPASRAISAVSHAMLPVARVSRAEYASRLFGSLDEACPGRGRVCGKSPDNRFSVSCGHRATP
jgi:hypothetical protein